jgi:hypothetical protein
MNFPSYNAIDNTNRNPVVITIEGRTAAAAVNPNNCVEDEVKIEPERMKTIVIHFLIRKFKFGLIKIFFII